MTTRVPAAVAVPVLAAAMAAATWLVGWPGVPAVAALVALVPRRGRRDPAVAPRGAALAGALAWGGVLAVVAAGGRLGAVVALVGGVVGQPGVLVVALTLALPALLAWSAATLAGALAAALRPPAPDPITLSAPGPTSRPAGAADAASGSPAAATP